MERPVILVTGMNGQLGSELQKLAVFYPTFRFLFADRSTLDIGDLESVSNYFKLHAINYCINAAAYTAVDKSETDQEAALLINADAVGNLALCCQQNNARFIHISTDYVFDGNATEPYATDHPTDPVNFYGSTKLIGEKLAQVNNPSCIIIRTSWVYSSFGNNFVKTMLRLMKDRESINVVSDQRGCPTYAEDLAKVILEIIMQIQNGKTDAQGIYHYSNSGIISWYDFAVAIKNRAGLSCQVNAIPSSDYPTPAKRPFYSAFDLSRIQNDFSIEPIGWEVSLERFFVDLEGSEK